MNRFNVLKAPFSGLLVLERQALTDERGFLSRLFCAEELQSYGWVGGIAQINHTHTHAKGTVRGMHFQYPPDAEYKLVTCLAGEVWDVLVDIREQSPTYLRWFSQNLSAANRQSILIPAGFAHGFQTLTDDAEMIYAHSQAYRPSNEGALRATDKRLAIPWPLPVTAMSERDSTHPLIDENFRGISLL